MTNKLMCFQIETCRYSNHFRILAKFLNRNDRITLMKNYGLTCENVIVIILFKYNWSNSRIFIIGMLSITFGFNSLNSFYNTF